jgi:hypothetical protein
MLMNKFNFTDKNSEIHMETKGEFQRFQTKTLPSSGVTASQIYIFGYSSIYIFFYLCIYLSIYLVNSVNHWQQYLRLTIGE